MINSNLILQDASFFLMILNLKWFSFEPFHFINVNEYIHLFRILDNFGLICFKNNIIRIITVSSDFIKIQQEQRHHFHTLKAVVKVL